MMAETMVARLIAIGCAAAVVEDAGGLGGHVKMSLWGMKGGELGWGSRAVVAVLI